MNFSHLSAELKSAFPDITPMDRPLVANQKILDPNWLSGFTTGEGCFMVRIINSPSRRLGFQIQLVFQLTQHLRDEQLMRSLIEYFDCGGVYINKEVYRYEVSKFSDIYGKIIPFFNQYQIQGVKRLDYQD
jgi:hypothetical protein